MSSKHVVDLRSARTSGETSRLRPVRARREVSPDVRAEKRGRAEGFLSTHRVQKNPLSSRVSKRSSPLRTQRRKIRLWASLTVLVLLTGIAYAASTVSYLPQYNISSVQVTGTQKLSAAVVSAYAQTRIYTGERPFVSPTNILTFDIKTFTTAIQNFFPRIKSVLVRRDSLLGTALVVQVAERQPFARWCSDTQTSSGVCFVMDDTGFLFTPADNNPATSTLPFTFSGGIATTTSYIGSSFVPAHLPGIRALFDQLNQAGFTPLGAQVFNNHDVAIPLTQGYILKVSYGEDPTTIIRDLKLVLSSSTLQNKTTALEYVDLRFGERAYFKLKTDTAKTSVQ